MHYLKRPDPTPDEIQQRMAEIREAWTDDEYHRRAKMSPSRTAAAQDEWLPPTVADPETH